MRILVVEDETRILSFVKQGLEAEGYTVEGSTDGRRGLALALGSDWDLLILDLLLPGMSGFELLQQLSAGRPELPVLVLSARADLPTKLRGFALGASDYVAKPFAFDELLARVRVHLRTGRSPGHDGNLVRSGALVLDLARRHVRYHDAFGALSDREFRVLHHLVEHENEVISRERLLADVWGYSFDPTSNVVDVCIRRLRKKLGPNAPIETVRNVGYRLVA